MGIAERRAREREARRKAVLDAARGLVAEKGFVATTTRQIAKRCELSEATLFFYFESKDEILTSLLFEGIAFMRRGLEEIAAMDPPSEAQIERMWSFFSEVQQAHPEYFQVFGYLSHPAAADRVSAEVREELARQSGDNLRLFGEILDRALGTDRGRLIADLIWATFSGLNMLRESRKNLGAPQHPTPDDLASVLALLLAGLRAAPPPAEGDTG